MMKFVTNDALLGPYVLLIMRQYAFQGNATIRQNAVQVDVYTRY